MTKSQLMVKVSSVCDPYEDPDNIIKVSEWLWEEAFSKLSEIDQAQLWNSIDLDLLKEAGLLGASWQAAKSIGRKMLGMKPPLPPVNAVDDAARMFNRKLMNQGATSNVVGHVAGGVPSAGLGINRTAIPGSGKFRIK